ncbi:MAG TPA: transglutaminase family protein [Solirubrobacteraceae bacterium]|nr:transglutaminase family protein [Solirubrobacteraceae bacterium]
MSTLYEVRHRTRYRYPSVVSASYGLLHMLPRELDSQRVLGVDIRISPSPESVSRRRDFFDNPVSGFVVAEPHTELEVLVVSRVEVESRAAALSLLTQRRWEEVRATSWAASADPELVQYVTDSPLVALGPVPHDYAQASFPAGRGILEAVADLTRRIHADFAYAPGTTTVSTPLEQVFAQRAGVCQDLAHVEIACLRVMGVAARYVSGYLETQPPPGREKLTGVDGSHAWVSLFLPGAGWLAVDPTNDTWVDGRYITTAVGRDYSDVPPMQGIIFSDEPGSELEVGVDVLALSRTAGG